MQRAVELRAGDCSDPQRLLPRRKMEMQVVFRETSGLRGVVYMRSSKKLCHYSYQRT
jgi:hypothetical protein